MGIEDFTTISIEFGYVVLFVTAFPIAPFLAFLNEYAQIRTDGWKLCRVYKRCQPVGAQDIGIWQSIFTMTAYASVVCNAAIVVFVMGDLSVPNYVKVWFSFSSNTCFSRFLSWPTLPSPTSRRR